MPRTHGYAFLMAIQSSTLAAGPASAQIVSLPVAGGLHPDSRVKRVQPNPRHLYTQGKRRCQMPRLMRRCRRKKAPENTRLNQQPQQAQCGNKTGRDLKAFHQQASDRTRQTPRQRRPLGQRARTAQKMPRALCRFSESQPVLHLLYRVGQQVLTVSTRTASASISASRETRTPTRPLCCVVSG